MKNSVMKFLVCCAMSLAMILPLATPAQAKDVPAGMNGWYFQGSAKAKTVYKGQTGNVQIQNDMILQGLRLLTSPVIQRLPA